MNAFFFLVLSLSIVISSRNNVSAYPYSVDDGGEHRIKPGPRKCESYVLP